MQKHSIPVNHWANYGFSFSFRSPQLNLWFQHNELKWLQNDNQAPNISNTYCILSIIIGFHFKYPTIYTNIQYTDTQILVLTRHHCIYFLCNDLIHIILKGKRVYYNYIETHKYVIWPAHIFTIYYTWFLCLKIFFYKVIKFLEISKAQQSIFQVFQTNKVFLWRCLYFT